jgi:cytochrome c-type biogenesis protein CcmH/NrfG
MTMPVTRTLVLAFSLLSTAAWAQDAALPAGSKVPAETLKRDFGRCQQADLDACYDAIRWSPGDPALLVALGDALVRAGRAADAIRSYRRAAALAPAMQGLAAKISAAEAKLSARRAPVKPTGEHASVSEAANRRYSNADPEGQSH